MSYIRASDNGHYGKHNGGLYIFHHCAPTEDEEFIEDYNWLHNLETKKKLTKVNHEELYDIAGRLMFQGVPRTKHGKEYIEQLIKQLRRIPKQ